MNERQLIVDIDLANALYKAGLTESATLPTTATIELDKDDYLFILRRLTETTGARDRDQARRVFVNMIRALRK